MNPAPRQVCQHCRRPSAVCYCAHLLPLPTRTRVVILQHPREAKVPIGTARMAHLMLPNSELLHPAAQPGAREFLFGAHPLIQQLTSEPAAATTALLFPGEGARDAASLDAGAIKTLVVIDGTWAQAHKVLKQNPLLERLLRIGLTPAQPGNYRIRREPAADCLATVEALAQVLGILEQAPQRFAAMLPAFTFMVDRQLEMAAARTEPPRSWKSKAGPSRADAQLREQLARALLVHAEVNAYARGSCVPGQAELLHLVAQRLHTGERFVAVLAPRRPLAHSAAVHLRIPEQELLSGEELSAVQKRWESFVQPHDVLCGWGHFTRDQLAAEGLATGPWLDLRQQVARRLQQTPGMPAAAADRLQAPSAEPLADGRAGAMVTQLSRIARALTRVADTAQREC